MQTINSSNSRDWRYSSNAALFSSGRILCRFAILLSTLLLACGEGKVAVGNESYEPRIVIEGFLQPGPGVERIRISRNFKVDANLQTLRLPLDDSEADVRITDESSGKEYELSYHPGENFRDSFFEYRGNDLVIEHGKSYSLEVRATIEGKELQARATTTVPEKGFEIVGVTPQSSPYRPLTEDGEPVNFELTLERSPGTTMYVVSIRPDPENIGSDYFIYDNPFTDETPQDVDEDIHDFDFERDWIQNPPDGAGQSRADLFWFFFWFYGEYTVRIYAVDENYMHFLQTFDDVQEDDGNFHEPLFDIEGDGIGVFGSVVADSIKVEVLRN